MDEKQTIQMLLERLLGEIEPVGETNEDNSRFKNFYYYEIVLNTLVDKLIECEKYKGKLEYSMNRAGDRAHKILKELSDELYDLF